MMAIRYEPHTIDLQKLFLFKVIRISPFFLMVVLSLKLRDIRELIITCGSTTWITGKALTKFFRTKLQDDLRLHGLNASLVFILNRTKFGNYVKLLGLKSELFRDAMQLSLSTYVLKIPTSHRNANHPTVLTEVRRSLQLFYYQRCNSI